MIATNTINNDLISVQLKTLINLAKPASLLKLHQAKIRAKQSGGLVSRFKGRGMEFDEARLYQPGDDIRSIDWRVTARTGKTHTKVFCEERERPVFISVDHRSSMQFATRGVFKSVQAAKIAALLAWTAQHKGDRIGGQIFTDNSCQELKPQNGKHGVLRFFNSLVKAPSPLEINITLEHALARLVQHARPGSLVYIISDFRGFDEQAENHLDKLAKHCDVVLIQVYDQIEKQLPVQGRYRFTDNEKDVTFDTSNSTQRLNYHDNFQHRQDALKNTAKKQGIAFQQCTTTDDPIEVIR